MKKRTPAVKTAEYREKGRSIKQMMCVARARGDVEWLGYLEGVFAEEELCA